MCELQDVILYTRRRHTSTGWLSYAQSYAHCIPCSLTAPRTASWTACYFHRKVGWCAGLSSFHAPLVWLDDVVSPHSSDFVHVGQSYMHRARGAVTLRALHCMYFRAACDISRPRRHLDAYVRFRSRFGSSNLPVRLERHARPGAVGIGQTSGFLGWRVLESRMKRERVEHEGTPSKNSRYLGKPAASISKRSKQGSIKRFCVARDQDVSAGASAAPVPSQAVLTDTSCAQETPTLLARRNPSAREPWSSGAQRKLENLHVRDSLEKPVRLNGPPVGICMPSLHGPWTYATPRRL